MTLKRRIIIGLTLLTMIFLSFCIGYISSAKADITPDLTPVIIEDCNSNNNGGVTSGSSNQNFYDDEGDRWYVFYCYLSGSVYPYYSYSDVGDTSSWNNGGNSFYGIDSSFANDMKPYYDFAVYYDQENNLGHLCVGVRNVGELYYKNFTISVGGSLTFGNAIKLYDASATVPISTDIVTDGTHIYIATSGYITGQYSAVFICDSTDGYNGAWTFYLWKPHASYRTATNIIPLGDNKVMQITANGELASPLRYKIIEYGVTANATGDAGTVLTDSNCYQYNGMNNNKIVSFGSAYNLTHAGIAYSDSSDKDLWAFIFDFETITKTDEYLAFDNGASYITPCADMTIINNEFFAFCVDGFPSNGADKDLILTEQHNPSYEGLFNTTGAVILIEDFDSDDWDYTYLGASITSHYNNDGEILVFYENGDNCMATSSLLVGETFEIEEPEETPFDWGYYIDSIGWFLLVGFIVVIAIFVLSMKIKYDSKRR